MASTSGLTGPRVIVLQHALEQKEPSNTGAPASRALPGSELRIWGAKNAPVELEGLDAEGTFLLFPGGPVPPTSPAEVKTLVVVDGSWSQARRMAQSKRLRGLPRLSLAPRPGRRSMRQAPPGGMSTIEALADALAWLGDEDGARRLEALHEALVQRVLRSRGYL